MTRPAFAIGDLAYSTIDRLGAVGRGPQTFGSSQGTLGDSMWVTPLLRAFPGSTLRMFDNASCRNVAQVYEGLVDHVEFCADPGVPPTIDLPTHVSERMLIAAGKPDASIIPCIALSGEEIAWASDYLARYGDPSRMVVIHTHNSGWRDPSNSFARHVKPPFALMASLAAFAAQLGYTVLQFCNEPWPGKPDNFEPLAGTHHIRGLTLRQTAACYSVIGRMLSGDTGDPYLALAAGARVIFLLCPEVDWAGYRWHNVVYRADHWKGERPRTRYHCHADPDLLGKVAGDLAFDW
jgi:hypothetical protein